MLSMDAYGTGLGENSYGWKSRQPQQNRQPVAYPINRQQPTRQPPAAQLAKADYSVYAPKQGAYQAYSPSQAQPVQPPSQGNLYGRFMVAPGQPAPSQIPSDIAPPAYGNTSFADHWNQFMANRPRQPNMTWTPARSVGGEGIGNLANNANAPLPEPFTTRVTGFDGNQYAPQDFVNQRDAFIQRLNDEKSRLAATSGQTVPGTARPLTPSRDFQSMWGQAGDMVQSGWVNPLAGLFG